MKDFSKMLQSKYGDKYNYLRVKTAEVYKQSKRINLTLYVPEDVFDYEFETDDIVNIKAALNDAVNGEGNTKNGFKFNLFFEKIYYDEALVRSAVIDYIKANFPYVGANIDFERMGLIHNEILYLEFAIQSSVYDYAVKSGFEAALKQYLENRFYLKCELEYEIVEEVFAPPAEENISAVRSVFIPISNINKLCGRDELKGASPKHISVISKAGDNIAICGKVESIECKIWDENKAVVGKKFFKYHYSFVIDDTSGKMRVLFNTNDEKCPLASITPDSELVIRGRVFYKEETGKFIMFAKGIARCKIDFETVKEQLAPLPPPEEYKNKPYIYDNKNGQQLQFDFIENKKRETQNIDAVALHFLSIPKANDEIIYEIACVKIREGVLSEIYHTFLKAPTDDKMSFEAKARTVTAPRIASVVPDLVKFTSGMVIVAIDAFGKLKRLNDIALPLRYVFHNELKEITTFGKKFKKDGGFLASCREAGINIAVNASALEYAEAIAKLYLKQLN